MQTLRALSFFLPGWFRSQVIPFLGGVKLKDLDGAALNRLYATLKDERNLKPKTIKNCHALIHRAMRDVVRWGLFPVNPADAADPPRVPRPQPDTWTADQPRTFLDHVAGDRLESQWRVMAMTGMRRGEVLGLRWSDLHNGTVEITQQVTDFAGEISISEPKTSGSSRQVVLDAATVQSLKDHRKRQIEERLAYGDAYQDLDLVFAREDGSPLRPTTITRQLTAISNEAGLPRATPHLLRHSWATLALRQGVHPKVVADRLGHSSVTVTLDRYSHVVQALDADAAQQVADLIDG